LILELHHHPAEKEEEEIQKDEEERGDRERVNISCRHNMSTLFNSFSSLFLIF
jgi:hypothetical protein